ncbi:MAG: extensin-like domain-containing protein [Hyphomicrobium sp.]
MVLRSVRVVMPLAVLLIAGPVLLSGCGTTGPDFVAKDEPWRGAEERACMSSGAVRQTAFLHGRSALNGPSYCGAEAPFEMSGALGGRVAMRPAALLRCPMIPQVDRWVAEVVEPAARFHFGASVAELKVAASYSCRAMNHQSGGRLSEHGYANALDISTFTLTNGEVVTVKGGWRGTPQEQAFLRDVHNGACQRFTTVLGPNYDANHRDHFHMDLARHGRDGLMRICK